MDMPSVAATPSGAQPSAAPQPSSTPQPLKAQHGQGAPRPQGMGPKVEVKPTPRASEAKPAAKAEAKPAPKAEAKPDTQPDTKPDAPKEPARKLKLKVDAEELELDESEVVRRAQKATAAEKRFEEAAKLRKEAEAERAQVRADQKKMSELLARLKDPATLREFLSDPRVGVNVKEFAQEELANAIKAQLEAEEEKTLSPETRRLRELEKWKAEQDAAAAKAKAEEETKAKTAAEQAREERVAKHRDDLGGQILQALKGATNLPQDSETALEVWAVVREHVEQGRPFDVKDVVAALDVRAGRQMASYMKRLGAEKASRLLDPDTRKALRELDVAEFKAKNPLTASSPQVATAQAKKQPEPKPQSGRSEADLRNSLLSRDWSEVMKRDSNGRFK